CRHRTSRGVLQQLPRHGAGTGELRHAGIPLPGTIRTMAAAAARHRCARCAAARFRRVPPEPRPDFQLARWPTPACAHLTIALPRDDDAAAARALDAPDLPG